MDSIEVYFSQSDDLKGDLSGLFEICEKVVIAADLDSGVRILNIRLCGAQEMIELNKKWRGKDKITDVLSFENTENAEIKTIIIIPTE